MQQLRSSLKINMFLTLVTSS